MKYQRNLQYAKHKIDGTGFAAVLAIIILFLLIESPLVFKPGISIELPSPQAEEIPGISGPTVVVGVDHNGVYYFDGKNTNEKQLLKQLTRIHERYPETTVVIAADRIASIDSLATLSTIIYRSGIQRIHIATKPAFQNPSR